MTDRAYLIKHVSDSKYLYQQASHHKPVWYQLTNLWPVRDCAWYNVQLLPHTECSYIESMSPAELTLVIHCHKGQEILIDMLVRLRTDTFNLHVHIFVYHKCHNYRQSSVLSGANALSLQVQHITQLHLQTTLTSPFDVKPWSQVVEFVSSL